MSPTHHPFNCQQHGDWRLFESLQPLWLRKSRTCDVVAFFRNVPSILEEVPSGSLVPNLEVFTWIMENSDINPWWTWKKIMPMAYVYISIYANISLSWHPCSAQNTCNHLWWSVPWAALTQLLLVASVFAWCSGDNHEWDARTQQRGQLDFLCQNTRHWQGLKKKKKRLEKSSLRVIILHTFKSSPDFCASIASLALMIWLEGD